MRIFNKQNNKDIAKKLDEIDEKIDLMHKSIARLRTDVPELVLESLLDIDSLEEIYN
jgi:hypothetical protein